MSKRPPVLAHEKFLADRASFVGLDLTARFDRIAQTNLWGAASSRSGLGSEIDATNAVAAALVQSWARWNIASLLDAPCGDAGWIQSCIAGLDYIGLDIVPSLIAANTERAQRGEIAGRFALADITRDTLPRADAILCRDCLVHLSFDNIRRAVANFRASGATWLIATTFTAWEANADCEDGDWRALNLQRAPFGWPEPIELIDERCEEADGGWRDKSLGIWRLAEIPDGAEKATPRA